MIASEYQLVSMTNAAVHERLTRASEDLLSKFFFNTPNHTGNKSVSIKLFAFLRFFCLYFQVMQLEKNTSIWLGGVFGLLVGLLTISAVDYIRPVRIPLHLTPMGFLVVIAISTLLGNYSVEKMFHFNESQWHRPVWVLWTVFVSTFPMVIILLSLIILFSFSF